MTLPNTFPVPLLHVVFVRCLSWPLQAKKGMVDGHAYSVIVVHQVDGHRLLCIRNPWGTFEWDKDWSDNDKMWTKYPDVKQKLM